MKKIIPLKYLNVIEDIKDTGVTDAGLIYVGKNNKSTQSTVLMPGLINNLVISGTSKVKIGDAVWKIGRTTKRTAGKVIGIEGTIIADSTTGKKYLSRNMITTNLQNFKGDSGAIGMIGDTNKAFGMFCIGAWATAYFSPIDDVLKALNVEIAQPIP